MSKSIEDHSREQKAGLKCPQCGAFIETSVFQLLTAPALECPVCRLKLSIDRAKSQPAIEVLRKVHQAKENLEKKSKFDR